MSLRCSANATSCGDAHCPPPPLLILYAHLLAFNSFQRVGLVLPSSEVPFYIFLSNPATHPSVLRIFVVQHYWWLIWFLPTFHFLCLTPHHYYERNSVWWSGFYVCVCGSERCYYSSNMASLPIVRRAGGCHSSSPSPENVPFALLFNRLIALLRWVGSDSWKENSAPESSLELWVSR